MRVLHIEWSRKVTVIYHNSDLDDYFGRHRQNRRKKFSPLSKLKRPVQNSVWSYEIFDISELRTGVWLSLRLNYFLSSVGCPELGFVSSVISLSSNFDVTRNLPIKIPVKL